VDGETPITVNVQGAIPGKTMAPEIVQKINDAFGKKIAYSIFDDTVVQLASTTSGIFSKIEILETTPPTANACEFVLGVDENDLTFTVPEYPWIYASPYPSIVSVPVFQDSIRDESVTVSLVEGTDHEVSERRNIAFKDQPPEKLWARRSLFDQENPWNNFGFLMDIYQENSVRYVNVIQGLWFAFWTGPRPRNVQVALFLLFGLPVAQESGVVTSVTPTTITTTGDNGVVREFEIPSGLVSAVVEGQSVTRFTPLVNGIVVLDKISTPGFVEEEIGRAGIQPFLTENASRGPGDTDETKALRLLEEHTFLPQISVDAFVNPDINLSNVQTFLNAIKPLSKTYLFQIIVGTFRDPVLFEERVDPSLAIDVTPNLDSNQTTFQPDVDLTSYETVDNDALNLDSEVILLQETVEIDVYSFAVLIDSFTA
jgi:hypothetical protein